MDPLALTRCAIRTISPCSLRLASAGLTAQSVTLIYRAMLDAARVGGLLGPIGAAEHDGWRIGLTKDPFASGQDLAGIMQALRWKSLTQPARHAQALAAEANAAAHVVGKR